MSSMRLEQGKALQKHQAKKEAPAGPGVEADYPSTRYFQIHFQHLYELVESLRAQVQEASRQIAAQNEMLRHLPPKSGAQPCPVCLEAGAPKAPRKSALVAQDPPPPYNPG